MSLCLNFRHKLTYMAFQLKQIMPIIFIHFLSVKSLFDFGQVLLEGG